MKRLLIIILTCVLLFSAGFALFSGIDVNHQQDQARTHSQHQMLFTLDDPFFGPWPPPDES